MQLHSLDLEAALDLHDGSLLSTSDIKAYIDF